MGHIYALLEDGASELQYQLKALALLEQDGEPHALLQCLNRVSHAYLDYYTNITLADAYARRVQQLALHTPGASDDLTYALITRGVISLRRHQYSLARTFLLEARRLAILNRSFSRVDESLKYLARVEEEAGNLSLALQYAHKIGSGTKLGGLSDKQNAEEILARIYEKLGRPQAALNHYRRYVGLRDTIQDEEKKKAGFRQKLSYEYERKEASLKAAQDKRQAVAAAEIRRQKQLRAAAMGGAGLLLLLAGGLYNRFRFQRRATAAITRAKQRSDELLLNILPAEVAEELKDTGKTTARHFDVVTVLFSDVVDFTQLSETLSPEQLVATLDTYFAAFDAITGRFGLEKIKTIGDAYMLAGGLGQGTAADPAQVVRAALAMLAAVEELRRQRAPQGLPCFALRIGLHTGPVVAGVVGVKKFAYDIWGDTVNTAARMESAGAPNRVNISEDTHTLVADRFACTPRGKLAAKHKGEIAMFFVDGER